MKMYLPQLPRLLAAAALLALGCSSGGGTGAGSPTPSTTSFRSDVAPILVSNCAGNGACHGTEGGAYIYLAAPAANASAIVASLVGKQTTEPSKMPYVTAGDPTQSYLQLKIDDTFPPLPLCQNGVDGGPCGVAMPKSAPPLSAADRATIRSWIAEGAHDN